MMITEEQIYMALCLTSVVVCMTDAVLLLCMRRFLREMDRRLTVLKGTSARGSPLVSRSSSSP